MQSGDSQSDWDIGPRTAYHVLHPVTQEGTIYQDSQVIGKVSPWFRWSVLPGLELSTIVCTASACCPAQNIYEEHVSLPHTLTLLRLIAISTLSVLCPSALLRAITAWWCHPTIDLCRALRVLDPLIPVAFSQESVRGYQGTWWSRTCTHCSSIRWGHGQSATDTTFHSHDWFLHIKSWSCRLHQMWWTGPYHWSRCYPHVDHTIRFKDSSWKLITQETFFMCTHIMEHNSENRLSCEDHPSLKKAG